MLQRIQKIRNLGAFQNCASASVPFLKWTVVYGRNSYGKSTLSDLMSSLGRNDPGPILERKSIPGDGAGQAVRLNFSSNDQKKSVDAYFENGKWVAKLPSSHRLKVYDESFYFSHVFSSRNFSRDTKAQFSAFVLGETGVSKAKLIAEKNKKKGDLSRDLSKLKMAAFASISDIEGFVNLNVVGKKEELEEEVERLRSRYSDFNKQKRNVVEINSRKEPSKISFSNSLIKDVERVNELLGTSFEGVHTEAKEKVFSHIKSNLGNSENAPSWIRSGLTFPIGESCGFCGQTLADDALALIDAYRQYFDESFERQVSAVMSALDQLMNGIQGPSFQKDLFQIEVNEGILRSYPEIEEFFNPTSLLEQHESLKARISLSFGMIESEHKRIIAECNRKIEHKRREVQSKVEKIDIQRLRDLSEEVSVLVDQYSDTIENTFLPPIKAFKATLKPDVIENNLNSVKNEAEALKRKILRIEKDDSCTEYKRIKREIDSLNEEIPKLSEQLQKEQSEYIDKFFSLINANFKAFGSDDFQLKKELNSSGHEPIYFISVLYKKQKINEQKIERVFSESDRRALSLSVFWAGLETLGDEELSKTIVVLDDPVTSFDDHRVQSTHSRMAKLVGQVGQLILLSHYREGISRLLINYGYSHSIQLLELVKDDVGTVLQVGDPELFCRTLHDQKREEIFDFIERRSARLTVSLRVFLEEELNLRFAKQIREVGLGGEMLGKKIDRLSEERLIDSKVSAGLHDWRRALNPENHTWVDAELEDQRRTAGQFMDFLYHELKAEPLP